MATRRRSRVRWAFALGFLTLIGVGATVAAVLGHKTGTPLVFAVAALVLCSFPYMACAFTSALRDLRIFFKQNGELGLLYVTGGLLCVYLLYAFGTGVFDPIALLRICAFIGVPAALAISAKGAKQPVWQDWVSIACVWLPFNFGLLDSIWEWPEGQAGYIMNTPLAITVALVIFLGYRGFDFVGFRLRIRLRDLKLVLVALVAFMVIAVPIGLGTGFLEINPKLDWIKLVGQPLAIFFFIAVPEEFLFRGLIQGMLLKKLGKPALAIVGASILFGLAHWHTVVPDVRYISLAAIAGLFYGFVYQKTGNIAVSGLLHASVDALWEIFFHAHVT